MKLTWQDIDSVSIYRRHLTTDLRKIKKHLGEINAEVINDLDSYFDVICEMARLDSQIFKSFFRMFIYQGYSKI